MDTGVTNACAVKGLRTAVRACPAMGGVSNGSRNATSILIVSLPAITGSTLCTLGGHSGLTVRASPQS